jgi:hypothetical protein
METKELRIGNYVYEETIEEPYQVVEVFEISTTTINDGFPKALSPIPITEEWLLDLGFKGKEKAYNQTFYYADSFSEWKVIHRDGLIKRNGKVIKHIHQLQNLYFALTGQELKLKNNE